MSLDAPTPGRLEAPTPGSLDAWQPRRLELAGAALVLLARLTTLPRTPWEMDEMLFLEAVRDFDPARYHPHPPGYPLFVGLGKLFNLVIPDSFAALVTLSVLSSVIAFLALCVAFRRLTGNADVALAGALLFSCSAGMLVHGSLALADSAAIAFLALAFASRHPALTGIFASFAIGCRPQLAIPLLPALAVLFVLTRRRWLLLAAFTVASLVWFVPLVVEAGGWQGFLDYELKQAMYVAKHDAGQSRGAMSLPQVAVRFVLHAWGSKVVTLPLLLLVGLGGVVLLRRWTRDYLPLVIFAVIHFGFAIATMDPADGVRYSLPAQILIALLAGLGLVRASSARPAGREGARDARTTPGYVALAGALVLAALSFWYAGPILLERAAKPSPVAAAAAYLRATAPANAVILHQPATRPFVQWFFRDRTTMDLDRGLRELSTNVPLVLYADGGSTAPDARVFAWRESDAYGKLTRNVFRNITVDPLRPEERYVPLAGVFALERNPAGEEWRWLAPAASLRLPPLGKRSVLLDLRLPADAPYDDTGVTILVDGRQAATTRATKRGTRAVVPAGTTVELRSARSFRPADVLRNRDPRIVAVQLVYLEQQ